MGGLPGLPEPGFSEVAQPDVSASVGIGLPGLPPPGFSTPAPIEQPSIGGEFIQGIKDTPSALLGIVKSVPSGLSNLLNSVISPIQSIQNGTTERTLRGIGSGALTTAGTLVGGPAGGAAGNQLFNDLLQFVGVDEPTTPEQDLRSMARGAGTILATGVAGDAVGTATDYVGTKLENYANKVQQEALGANANTFAASARRDGVVRSEEVTNPDGSVTQVPLKIPKTELHQALEGVKNEGLITAGTTAADLSMGIASRLEDLGVQVRTIINKADELRDAQGIKIYPQLKNAQEYIETRAPLVDRPALRKELAKWNEAFRTEGDGSLGIIQDQKIELGNRTYSAGKESAEAFDKALTSDLRRTIEDVTNEALGKDSAGTIAKLNERMGNLFEVQKIPDIAAIRDANKSTTAFMHNLTATTGGAVGQGLIGLGVGGPIGGAIGLGTGLATRYLQTPGGKVVQSGLVSPLAKALQSVADIAPVTLSASVVANKESQKPKSKPSEAPARQQDQSERATTTAPTSPALKNQISDASSSLNPRPISTTTQAEFSPMVTGPSEPSQLLTLLSRTTGKDMDLKQVKQLISRDPVDATIMEMESGGDPKAKNPDSSASGLFQLLKKTAKALGVKDVFDPEENYKGYLKLKEEAAPFVEQPEDYYAYHYLGNKTYLAWKRGAELTDKEREQVAQLEATLLPRFRRIYEQKIGMVEA